MKGNFYKEKDYRWASIEHSYFLRPYFFPQQYPQWQHMYEARAVNLGIVFRNSQGKLKWGLVSTMTFSLLMERVWV